MTVHFDNCDSLIEVLYFVLFLCSVITSIISSFMVYGNEIESTGKKAFLIELFGGISVFFTGELLNEKGKKWRPIFVSSVLLLITLVMIGLYLKPCTQ